MKESNDPTVQLEAEMKWRINEISISISASASHESQPIMTIYVINYVIIIIMHTYSQPWHQKYQCQPKYSQPASQPASMQPASVARTSAICTASALAPRAFAQRCPYGMAASQPAYGSHRNRKQPTASHSQPASAMYATCSRPKAPAQRPWPASMAAWHGSQPWQPDK